MAQKATTKARRHEEDIFFVPSCLRGCVCCRRKRRNVSRSATASAERGRRRERQAAVHDLLLLLVPRHRGSGRRRPRILARATADPLIRDVRKPTGGNMPPYTSKVISDQ